MKKSVLLFLTACAAVSGVNAQEFGRVISSTPVIQQVAVPRQVCNNQPMVVQQPNSGAGSLMGAIAGGAMGNAIGDGGGRAAATVIGLIGGAVLGNRIEGSGSQQVQNYQQCTTQTFYENRATSYNVTYDYAGKQYTVQMPFDPGPTIRLQVTPVGASADQSIDDRPAASTQAGVPIVSTYVESPTYVQSPSYGSYGQSVYTHPGTVIYQHPYYPSHYYNRPSYYPPVGLSLNFGYSRGGHRHHHRHRHHGR